MLNDLQCINQTMQVQDTEDEKACGRQRWSLIGRKLMRAGTKVLLCSIVIV